MFHGFPKEYTMRYLRILALVGIFLGAASFAHAQGFSVGIGVGPVYGRVYGPAYAGPAPVCVYGYYGYYPYACAPYGYYGPNWFSGGFFIGAGPWFPHAYYGRPGFPRGPVYWSHPAPSGRPGFGGRPVAPVNGFHGGGRFPVQGSGSVHGEGSFHSGGGFHGGGRR